MYAGAHHQTDTVAQEMSVKIYTTLRSGYIKVSSVIAQYGIFTVVGRIFGRFFSPLIELNIMVVHEEFRANKFTADSVDLGSEFELFTVRDKCDFGSIKIKYHIINDASYPRLKKIMDRGETTLFIIVSRADSEVAAYSSVQRKGIYKFGLDSRVRIPESFSVAKNLLVLESYRRQGLSKALNIVRLQEFSGISTIFVLVLRENIVAQRTWTSLGVEDVGTILQIRFLKRYSIRYFFMKKGSNSNLLEMLEIGLESKGGV